MDRRGDKKPLAEVARARRTRLRNIEAGLRAKRKERAAQRAPKVTLRTGRGRGLALGSGLRFLASLEPAEWYALADMRDASGLPYNHAKFYSNHFVRRGYVERVENPDRRDPQYRKGLAIHVTPRPDVIGPKYLYRLTARGAELGALGRMLQ